MGKISGLKRQNFEERTGRLHIHRSISRRKCDGVRVRKPKTESGARTILLPPSTAVLLKQQKKCSYSIWRFYNPTMPELPLSPPTAYGHLKVLLQRTELPPMHFYDLRHRYVKPAAKVNWSLIANAVSYISFLLYRFLFIDCHKFFVTHSYNIH